MNEKEDFELVKNKLSQLKTAILKVAKLYQEGETTKKELVDAFEKLQGKLLENKQALDSLPSSDRISIFKEQKVMPTISQLSNLINLAKNNTNS